MANQEVFDHFFITRFNLRPPKGAWQTDKSNESTALSTWLEHRFDIFEKYCLPSIKNQSVQNFKWLIYFDTTTNEKYLPRIENLAKDYSNITIKFEDGYEAFQQKHRNHVLELLDKSKEFVITTRMDNDDALHKDYIKRVQSVFDQQDFMAVNFVNIYSVMLNPPRHMSLNYLFTNHFVSLIERVKGGKIEGCYSRRDREWDVKGRVKHIKSGGYCLELIHGKNLYNELKGFPVIKSKDLKDFSLDFSSDPTWMIKDKGSFVRMFFKLLMMPFK